MSEIFRGVKPQLIMNNFMSDYDMTSVPMCYVVATSSSHINLKSFNYFMSLIFFRTFQATVDVNIQKLKNSQSSLVNSLKLQRDNLKDIQVCQQPHNETLVTLVYV